MNHFHPSVSVNASHLLNHHPMSGKPDMTIHTLTHFLDRFIYRTPKASATTRGGSIMQPLAGSDTKDRLVVTAKGSQDLPPNSEEFWKKKTEDVAAEDVFFHEYFSRVGKSKDKAQKKRAKDAGGRGEENAEGLSDAESEIWEALVKSRPDLEDAGDSDDDLDLDDLESAYDQGENDEAAESDGGVIFNDESDEEMEDLDAAAESDAEEPPTKGKTKGKKMEEEEALDEEDDFDMDASDEEAFVGSDEELPSDIDLGGVELPKEDEASGRKKRRKLKHLPTFASADDYAALLAGEDEGM